MGAAFLSGLAVGFWKSGAEVAALRTSEKIFLSEIGPERRRQLQRGWTEAVERVKSRMERYYYSGNKICSMRPKARLAEPQLKLNLFTCRSNNRLEIIPSCRT
jgi:hypothetical protein